jgi:hypothetical protein
MALYHPAPLVLIVLGLVAVFVTWRPARADGPG